MSIRQGYLGAAKLAKSIGGTCFQYFPKNPRRIGVKAFDPVDAEACAAYCIENNIQSIAHAPYPTSLIVLEKDLRQRMKASILNDLAIAERCGSLGVVVHFGKCKSENPLEGYRIMISLLDEILEQWHGKAKLLLENNAGQGIRMGTTFEELVQVRALTQDPDRIGFCLDTCHAFASGLWDPDQTEIMISKGERIGYFQHLVAVHFNDSVYSLRSCRDRHAKIGQGQIGMAGFHDLLSYPLFTSTPLILETPKGESGSHEDEIQFVRRSFGTADRME